MKNLTPVQSLILLVLAGIAVSGWFYGVYWKRVASGSLFSPDEKVLIQLQDQISALHDQNARLQEKIAELTPAPEE
ncbi:MAG: hypothetical protein P1U86_20090 [Verrucomicrobiales bacterium]|nr:hypothetical protein [Verrucomicrobiales bacterium]